MAQDGWLDSIGPYKVEHHFIPRSRNRELIRRTKNHIGVLHTSEGPTIASMFATFAQKADGTTYTMAISETGQIYQMRPLWAQAGSLPNNQNRFAQFQLCLIGSCKLTPWIPDEPQLQPFLTLLKYFSQEPEGIPLRRPTTLWPEDYADLKGKMWAINNVRRQQSERNGFWPNQPGWHGHMEVPKCGPSWHYDPGMFQWGQAFELATALPWINATFLDAPRSIGDGRFLPLMRGSRGPRVAQVQRWLKNRMFDLGKSGPNRDGVDQVFGKMVGAAVAKFRLDRGLSPIEVVDEKTWNLLKA